jgi:PKD repeat protein
MRKMYIFSLLLIFVISSNAQVNLPSINPQPINHPYIYNVGKYLNNKTVTCVDTVRYPQTKTSSLEYDTMATGIREGAAQYYHFSGTGIIHGISAYLVLDLDGIPGNSDSVQVMARVMKVNSFNEPVTHVDSSLVTVYDVGWNEQALMFDTPINITDSFAIAIEIPVPFSDTLFYITNSSVAFDGAGEGLASIAYQGIWYNYYMRGWGWDVDIILSPIFEQDITSSYTTDMDSICPGDSVAFTNTSVNCTDAMFNNFNTTTNPLYTWDFNDGTGTYNPTDTTYVFNSPGAYNTELTTTYYGYSLYCNDVSNHSITVFDTAIANFGFTQGGVSFMFHDSSSNASSYLWDFGDGSPLDNSQNPIHTFPIGNYQVCLTVTDSNGCNVNVFCDSVEFTVGITDYEAPNHVNIYPIPATNFFNVTVPSNYFHGEIVVTDVVGKKLKTVAIENKKKINVPTIDIASGVYFVSIDYEGERVFTKRIVIDR